MTTGVHKIDRSSKRKKGLKVHVSIRGAPDKTTDQNPAPIWLVQKFVPISALLFFSHDFNHEHQFDGVNFLLYRRKWLFIQAKKPSPDTDDVSILNHGFVSELLEQAVHPNLQLHEFIFDDSSIRKYQFTFREPVSRVCWHRRLKHGQWRLAKVCIVWRGRNVWWWEGWVDCYWRTEGSMWNCTCYWVFTIKEGGWRGEAWQIEKAGRLRRLGAPWA